jgi:hypothetical protein
MTATTSAPSNRWVYFESRIYDFYVDLYGEMFGCMSLYADIFGRSDIACNDNDLRYGVPTDAEIRDAERRVVGCLLFADDALQLVDDLITPESFLWPAHGRLYATIRDLIRAGRPRTAANLGATTLTQVYYLRRLLADAAMLVQVRDYAQLVRDAAIEYSTDASSEMREAA